MSFDRSSRNPILWFIPGTLVCVFVLAGLCLFFIHRQINSEENRLRDLELLSLEQTQQLFRQAVEEQWQKALLMLPEKVSDYQSLRTWDRQLGEETLGFCLDNSGLLVYPAYQIYPLHTSGRSSVKEIAGGAFLDPGLEHPQTSSSLEYQTAIRPDLETLYREMLAAAERNERKRALTLSDSLLNLGIEEHGAQMLKGFEAWPGQQIGVP